ncbi:autoinducer 2 ABC transporter substrate-binding protein [Paenibacillus validus]|uniref:autoinducer 2 ABC transporter substrate-binding protein n=1 Tax=Paenibacillus validus TaxID=44253 RepID=UPI000FD80D5D|nr:autoinducer 2 ABC transporter substrate-binding protein [Paenibacillus validus]MED4599812.1 autoinducer 2 ABC transporter substrate-binding protein [Paenibacillus validus]MED4604658.1 autoinducer 2 ABC transporter substrate-binding protein [Paenibacillus validus]
MKKIIAIILIFLILGSACNSVDPPLNEIIYMNSEKENQNKQLERDVESAPYTIAFVPKVMEKTYSNAAVEGAKEAARDLGIKVVVTVPPTSNPEDQIQIIKKLIAQKVNAIAISASDPVKLLPVLREARRHHIKVITWDSDSDPSGRDFFVNMVDEQTLGRHLMDMLAWSLNETGDFAVLAGPLTDANVQEWIKWISFQQEQYYPNMRLVKIGEIDHSNESAVAKAKEILETYPNLSGLIGASYIAPPAAAQAVQEAGLRGSVKIVGIATPNSTRTLINDGSLQMITLWSPRKLGYLTVMLAKNLLDGQYPYDRQAILNVGNIRMRLQNNMVIMGEPIDFVKGNIDQYDF